MKRNLFSIIPGMVLMSVLAFSGCEAGLTSNDGSEPGDSGFSFSDLYSRIEALKEGTKRLGQINEEQVEIIERLNSTVSGHTNSITNLNKTDVSHTKSINSLNSFIAGRVPLYRILRDNEHFYTTYIDERNECINNGHKDEGIQCYVFQQ
ncbi:MAG: hypothetical protein GY754_37755 [bacterium]|nr:hypothetical protein [bacterium]